MYQKNKVTKTSVRRNESFVGQTLEQKVRAIVETKEPITDGAPLIYTERAEGVLPQYDIRTDRWEIALDAMDAVAKAQVAKRDSLNKKEDPASEPAKVGEPQSNVLTS